MSKKVLLNSRVADIPGYHDFLDFSTLKLAIARQQTIL